MPNRTNLTPAWLDLSLTAKLDQVSMVRCFIEDYFRPLLDDPDLLSRMAIAAHELLENAAKYSACGASRLEVSVSQTNRGKRLSVKVSNIPAPGRIGELEAAMASVTAPEDAAHVYTLNMMASAVRGEGSGLGLARIRAEAEMTLSLTVDDVLACVEAVTTDDPGASHD